MAAAQQRHACAVTPGESRRSLAPARREFPKGEVILDYISGTSRRMAGGCSDTLMPASRPGRTIRTRTRRSLDVRAGRLVRLTLAGMFA